MKKRGKGIASIFYGTGYGNGFPDVSNARAELREDGRIYVYAGATEVGQGAKTALSQIAAEAMGVSLEEIILINEDTSKTPDSGTAAASRQTYNTGNGIRIACESLKQELLELAKEMLGTNSTAGLRIISGAVEVRGLPDKKATFIELYKEALKTNRSLKIDRTFTAHSVRMDDETGQGAPYWPYTFATYCVEVEVDTETGKVDVLKAVCAQDVGRAVNPTLIEGQIEGGFAMGMSWTLYEDLGLKDGRIKNDNFSNYIIPTSLDMPEIKNIIIEDPESTAPFGAKGIGEPVMLAAMPAILNAIYDATGVRVTKLPASPQEIVRLINEK
ncbi:MAG: xanthine dehydrogenase family protein molybdopterin-binding subunit [Bacillota bacterium]